MKVAETELRRIRRPDIHSCHDAYPRWVLSRDGLDCRIDRAVENANAGRKCIRFAWDDADISPHDYINSLFSDAAITHARNKKQL